MKQPVAPCLDCEYRQTNCHSKCLAYQNYRFTLDIYNEKVKEQRDGFIQGFYPNQRQARHRTI